MAKVIRKGKAVRINAEELAAFEKSRAMTDAQKFDDLVTKVKLQVKVRLNQFAASRDYDSSLSCVSYINSSNPKFRSDAVRMIELRDTTWGVLDRLMESVKTGETPAPTSVNEVFGMLPTLEWEPQ
jgi:hypothetical protein